VSWHHVSAALALVAGDYAAARQLAEETFFVRNSEDDPTERLQHVGLSIKTLIDVLETGKPDPEEVHVFEQSFGQFQYTGEQDFAAYAVGTAVAADGRVSDARKILEQYFTEARVERYRPPAFLTDLVSALNMNDARK
jgi:hypothetical protein